MSALIGGRLRQAREAKGLTQVQLSDALKVAKTLFGQYERGDRDPSLDRLKDVCRFLNVSSDWLLGLDDAMPAALLRPADEPPARGRADVLAREGAPAGLRALAEDADLIAALRIAPEEWTALASLDCSAGLSKGGYVALLMLVRQGDRVA